jgi:acetylornithine deacetylase
MDAVQLTRALVDIESTTGAEARAGEYLYGYLAALAARTGGVVERMPVTTERFNVLATWGTPVATMSTHIDTVPPFFA